ncbi:hypothetical protein QFC22_005447 [Naganishia vaughanmartiniae]|uniref:Uncharacterized protein n=1 Tax=Naganishia vaughanmartiniae TaxID=1424756 RepID=A0ACC2WU03_9TREE|nr:hypothetical protein QFC22_005447 [Naganishia vaughanmartiniae]
MPKAAVDKDGEKIVKKPKAKKDPNAPKRAMSAFMFYSMAERDNVKTTNPDLSFGEIGKQLGEQWRGLSAEQKKPYEQEAEDDKVRAAREKAAYEKDGTAAPPRKKKGE